MKRLFMGACWADNELDVMAERAYEDYSPDVFFYAGDFPYTQTAITRWGITVEDVSASLANNTDVAVYRLHHDLIRASPYTAKILASGKQCWYMWDDHETPLDDGAKDLDLWQTTADDNGGATWSGAGFGTDQDDLDAAWLAARTAATENMTGNPPNAVTDDTDAEYFSYVMGSVTYVVTDQKQYCSSKLATDDIDKVMLGANQEAWFIDAVNNATTPFVAWCCTKPIFQTGGSQDTFFYYQTELDRIFDAITKTGVFVLSGDQHWPCVAYGEVGDSSKVDVLNVVGCPTAQQINPTSGPISATNIWKYGGIHQDAAQPFTKAAILLEDPENDEWVRIRLLSPIREVDHWFGYIHAGSNEIKYELP